MFDGARCVNVCVQSERLIGLRGICHLFVLAGRNLFIETAHLFSQVNEKQLYSGVKEEAWQGGTPLA